MSKKQADEEQRLFWMQMDWPRYMGETTTFNNRHHGACLMLMGSVWLAKGALPAPTEEDLAQAARCSESEWAYVRDKVMARFLYEGGVLSQPAMDVAYAHAQEVSSKRKLAGAAGGKAKAARAAAAAAQPPAEPGKTDFELKVEEADRLANARANAVANEVAKGQQNPRQSQSHSSTNVEDSSSPLTGGEVGDQAGQGDDAGSGEPPAAAAPARAGKSTSAWAGSKVRRIYPGIPPRVDGKPVYPDVFEPTWAAYPNRPNASKFDAYKAWAGRANEGVPVTELHDGTVRYAAWCAAWGKTRTNLVMEGQKFFGPSRRYEQPWEDRPAPGEGAPQRFQTAAGRRAAAMDAYDQIGEQDHANRDRSVVDVQARVVR
jgi:uncharacterized protein YdaU (DUF1376 family)